mmetsp:Transcript_23234/g.43308  ORF Transcript_23234/g.43308 Transcript_23234/m.43308 type:complete len:215 (+) Transcript_23234:142-786(+)|eukprot:CAMPEP_0184528510 /NCGR_PEP_ID=MMETSP0198_2-20121128/11831_1 /TAXON_ID=1112570 /ORGANISM="Thraustochytrium sp., Strain LLF1b" /LENGTH=214 /DNA_ID=CAMNT_0026920363 /DNA_START=66 /DNA_END=710 /DNA_ORIENTATION=+
MADQLSATKGIHNVAQTTEWDEETYKRKALERADRESGAQSSAQLLQRSREGDQFLQARNDAIDFTKTVGKSKAVTLSSVGTGKAGFFCEACERTYFDSASYLAHLNSREHLSKLGQSLAVRKSSVEDVRQRLRDLINTKYGYNKSKIDTRTLEQRVKDAEEADQARLAKRRERKRQRKALAEKQALEARQALEDPDAMAQLGFSSFGSKKRRK